MVKATVSRQQIKTGKLAKKASVKPMTVKDAAKLVASAHRRAFEELAK